MTDEWSGTFRRLNDALKEYQESRAKDDLEQAPLFSAFEALFPNECSLSRAIAYLFDKDAGHGQQDIFLRQFLDLIGCPTDLKPKLRRVQPEYFTRYGRKMDILLEFDTYLVGIENKPWAGEQAEQCEAYAKELDRLSGEGRQWKLVFLTGDGRKPETAGAYRDQITLLSYHGLLNAFSSQCERVQHFIDDFRRFAAERIKGDERAVHPKEKKMLEEFLQPENRAVTLEILVRARTLRQKILGEFRATMLSKIQAENPDQGWNACLLNGSRSPAADLDDVSSGLYFFKPKWNFAIGFSNAGTEGMIFGIFHRVPEIQTVASLKKALDESFGVFGKSTPSWWSWWIPLCNLVQPAYQDWNHEPGLKRMALKTDEMVNDLYPLVEKAIKSAGPLIDNEVVRLGPEHR